MQPWTLDSLPDQPYPLDWADYEAALMPAWRTFLDSPDSEDEAKVHRFLEAHPSLVPGAFSMDGPSGHIPWPAALISRPPLAGLNARTPDFCWIATDSATVYVVLVEIETPTKRWWTAGTTGQIDQHHELTHALGQLREWKEWIDRYGLGSFARDYRIPADLLDNRQLVAQHVLIHGRRGEANRQDRLGRMRNSLGHADEYLMTFDRLAPDPKAAPLATVRLAGDGYHVLAVPPCFGVSEYLWDWQRQLIGLGEAIRDAPLSPQRRDSLLATMGQLDHAIRRQPPILSTGLL